MEIFCTSPPSKPVEATVTFQPPLSPVASARQALVLPFTVWSVPSSVTAGKVITLVLMVNAAVDSTNAAAATSAAAVASHVSQILLNMHYSSMSSWNTHGFLPC